MAFLHPLSNKLAKALWEIIPAKHTAEVLERRRGGYFSSQRVISPEAAKKAAKILKALDEEHREKMLEATANIASMYRSAVSSPRRSRRDPVEVNEAAVKTMLSAEEAAEFISLVQGKSHPFEGRVIELKNKTGRTWSELTK